MAQRNTFRDDEDLEEKINMRDLARVGVYLKPYMARVVWILIVVAAMGCINVVEPYLTKIMIDSVIPAKNLALLGELVALLAVLIVIYEFGLRYRTVEITRVGQLMLKDMRRDIFTHIQYCRTGSICIILLAKLCVFLLLVCGNDTTGRVDNGTQSVLIEKMYQICALTALCTVTGHQNKCLGHYLTKYLALLRIGCAYHSTYIAVRIAHAVSSPGCDLFSYQLIQRSAIN